MNDDDWVRAMNAISEVVMNRPLPLRAFDQIYMRAGDMVQQAIRVGNWAQGQKVAFIGDGDGIALSVAVLVNLGIIKKGPERIKVFDFDERIVNSVRRLANKERLKGVEAELYNCLDAFPEKGAFDRFYTNPPWGESNEGNSVVVFARRGIEAIGYRGQGMIVIADDPELEWPSKVLQKVQAYAIGRGFYVASMEPMLHGYHLPEAEHLRSCNLVVGSVQGTARMHAEDTIEEARLTNFYGRSKEPRVKYVRDRARPDHDRAIEQDYTLEMWENLR
ncbi:bis-aminopropyl spermidine synthase family protein [Sphingomonas sp. AR_OL41]|uniref:bis-aminopropyl spermidine synthase family protein n=1 Tax=Sphingomonas sp. AR_OL41 TaxID=3042729 RepID=UPI002481255F|nr:bis-aminopropyl spermidine synthase family protein [Sphingomonas sp. AR_OL41]MDH7972528.1 bis-aminopropyl spermidine synthase family protein [Sphingomonas sp. AR_OL41]